MRRETYGEQGAPAGEQLHHRWRRVYGKGTEMQDEDKDPSAILQKTNGDVRKMKNENKSLIKTSLKSQI